MAVFIYICSECKKDIKKQKYDKSIEDFKQRIESSQQIDTFDRFPPPFLKKRFERQIRLIAQEKEIGEDIVVVFLRVLVRGGNDYSSFGQSGYKEVPGMERISDEITEEKLKQFIKSHEIPPPPPPPAPSDEESSFLYSVLGSSHDAYGDYHICETKMWTENILKDEFNSRLSDFVDPVLETLGESDDGILHIKCSESSPYGIVFRRLPKSKRVILFTPYKGNTPPIAEVNEQHPDLIKEEPPSEEVVLRKIKRAYPHELVMNPDSWFIVQKDKDGNMALSEEEIDVLNSARKPSGGYPLFINGRAGSGKSTILQYLFAEYIRHYVLSDQTTSQPIFFACNDELLSRSGKSVLALVETQILRENKIGEVKLKEQLQTLKNSCFVNFHDSLLKLVPPEKFRRDRLIDYGSFRKWWEDSFSNEPSAMKLYDADVSWHVIRTYIKGISAEGFLDSSDYEELPRSQKSVTLETYQLVFEHVFTRYQKHQHEKGFWDHQDLARKVIEDSLIAPKYPVIFCDEAQDFTRIELEILHRHSLFNQRTVQYHECPQIPLAFAGDPFQTLNPTGFRWEATKAFFTEKFIKKFPGQDTKQLNYCELSFNYRSNRPIVNFCNSLQLARRAIFGFDEIKPQQPWQNDNEAPNVSYYENNLDVLEKLKAQSEIRIIVPCEEGGEAEWVRNNGLADFVEFDDADVPKNVVSPTRVKGLEFPRVVLFGFGGACPAALRKALANTETEPIEGDSAIEPQYFLNRLYVAASRPRKRLFVVDNPSDIIDFWNAIFSNQEEYALKAAPADGWDESVLGQVKKGNPVTWDEDKEDPLETAEQLAAEGRSMKDRILLRQAAQSFRNAGKETQEKQCRAEALDIEQEFLQSAELWKEIKDFERAMRTCWKAGSSGFELTMKIVQERPQLKNKIHYKFVQHLKEQRDINAGVALLKDLVDELSDENLQSEVTTIRAWRIALNDVISRMIKSNEKSEALWKVAYARFRQLDSDYKIAIPSKPLGEFAYRSGDLRAAYSHWSQIDPNDRSSFEKEFLRAKAATVSYPENIETVGELLKKFNDRSDAENISTLARQEGYEKLNLAHKEIVCQAALTLGNLEEAARFVGEIFNTRLLGQLTNALAEGPSDESLVTECLSRLLIQLLDSEDWFTFSTILRTESLDDEKRGILPYGSGSNFKTWAHDRPRIVQKTSIEILAETDFFATAPNDVKNNLADYLKRSFSNDLSWKEIVHPILVGFAFERAGLFKETLPFYELVFKSQLLHEDTRRLAEARWAKTKLNQSLFEYKNGSKTKASKHEAESKEVALQLGFISPLDISDDLPEHLPKINPPIREQRQPRQGRKEQNEDYSLSMNLENLSVSVNPLGNRVNIEDVSTFEQATIKVSDRIIRWEDSKLELDSEDSVFIEEWSLRISLANLENGQIELKKEGKPSQFISIQK